MPTWPNRSVKEYITALRDADHRVRRQAAAALEVLGDRRAVQPLLQTIQDSHPDVRRNVVRALGKLGVRRAVTPLVALVCDDLDANIRAGAIQALAQLGGRRVVPALIHALHDRDSTVRYAATTALGRLGDVRAIQPLVATLRDPQRRCELVSATALGQFGAAALPALRTLLTESDSDVRELALQALGWTKERQAIALTRAALLDADAMVRQTAQLALAQLHAHVVLATEPFTDDTDLPDTIRWLAQHLRQQYQQSGAPYGDTPAGLQRWLVEQGET